jgi:hypothetical protein
MIPNEISLTSLEVLSAANFECLKPAIKSLEYYLREEFGNRLQFN